MCLHWFFLGFLLISTHFSAFQIVLAEIADEPESVNLQIEQLTELLAKNRARVAELENELKSLKETINQQQNSDIDPQSPCQTMKPNVLCLSNNEHGANWIVIQQRIDLMSSDFNRGWSEFRHGFGTVSNSTSFWWGLERIHQLTKNNTYELLIEMKYRSRDQFARYSHFAVGSEAEKYKLLELSGFSGNEHDVNTLPPEWRSAGQMFSTFDSDNDQWAKNCAADRGGGWWWNNCGYTLNLTGSKANWASWSSWNGGAARSTRMSIRERKDEN